MSLAAMDFFGFSYTLDLAVENSIAAGVSYAVAAANDAFDACYYTPARVPAAMTMGASDQADARASFSNYGSCIDWFAPGVGITSAWASGDNATLTASGTSMSSPHTAGVAAIYLESNPGASPANVRAALFNAATKSVVSGAASANNHLLFNLATGDPGSGNARPTAAFTWSCSGLTCSFTDGSSDTDGTVAAWSWNFGDGATSTASSPSHTYASGGDYAVTLIVTDDLGATSTPVSRTVSVVDPSNQAPVAAFDVSCTYLTCTFTDLSTDTDGTVTGWSWDFGDGSTSSAHSPSHDYASAGTWTVTLVATDDDGARSASVSRDAVATDPPSLVLTATVRNNRGSKSVLLQWTPSMTVDVWRARVGDLFPSIIAGGVSGSSYEDVMGKGGSAKGSWFYFVCKTGDPELCSNLLQVDL
jgi:PKD repeat protein